MVAFTSFPVTKIPKLENLQVVAIYGSALCPCCGQAVRVRVVDVRTVYDTDPSQTWQVVDVLALTGREPFNVRREQLTNIKVFAALTIAG